MLCRQHSHRNATNDSYSLCHCYTLLLLPRLRTTNEIRRRPIYLCRLLKRKRRHSRKQTHRSQRPLQQYRTYPRTLTNCHRLPRHTNYNTNIRLSKLRMYKHYQWTSRSKRKSPRSMCMQRRTNIQRRLYRLHHSRSRRPMRNQCFLLYTRRSNTRP